MRPPISVLFVLAAAAAAPEYYQSRYDHLDIESILNNRRMVNYYAACLLSKGACPPQGLDLKRILPEALRTNCAKCTEKQKTTSYRTIKRLRKEYPKIWDQLQASWDPDDVFVRKFEANFENNKLGDVSQPAASSQVPVLLNRFGDDDPVTVALPPRPSSTSTSTTTSSTTTTTTTFTTKPTNKPFSTQAPPFATVGANLQATVSFGTNLVGGIVRSLGTLGSKVVDTGTRLANVVISAAFRN